MSAKEKVVFCLPTYLLDKSMLLNVVFAHNFNTLLREELVMKKNKHVVIKNSSTNIRVASCKQRTCLSSGKRFLTLIHEKEYFQYCLIKTCVCLIQVRCSFIHFILRMWLDKNRAEL